MFDLAVTVQTILIEITTQVHKTITIRRKAALLKVKESDTDTNVRRKMEH